jgi:DNA-directed RNA polymerase subunit beta'
MVLGMYYLTIIKDSDMAPKGYFYNFQDAISALEAGVIKLHDKITVRDEKNERIETTAGRIIFNEAVRNALV